MKKQKVLFTILIIVFYGFVLSSCEEQSPITDIRNEQTNSENIKQIPLIVEEPVDMKVLKNIRIESGMLWFTDFKQFRTVQKAVRSMREEELDQWEQMLGFNSYRSKLNKAYSKLDKVRSEAEADMVLKNYSDILKVEKNKDNEDVIVEKVKDIEDQAICNPYGIFRIGNYISKIEGTTCVTTKIDNLSEIRDLSEEEVKIYRNTETTIVYQYKRSSVTLYANNQGGKARIKYDKKTRECYLQFYLKNWVDLNNYNPPYYTNCDARIVAWGQKKSWGKWRRYKTGLTVKDINLRAFLGFKYVDYNKSYKHMDNSRELLLGIGTTAQGADFNPDMWFTNFSGKASSRGVHGYGKWATLSYK